MSRIKKPDKKLVIYLIEKKWKRAEKANRKLIQCLRSIARGISSIKRKVDNKSLMSFFD